MAAEPQNENHRTIRFGVFDADLRTQELRRQGTRLKLPRQSFQILQMLLERSGELVTREELQNVLWPGDTFVDFDHGLNNAVKRIRAALGDSAETPRYIETLPRMGYRFIGPIASNGNGTATAHGTNGAAVAERETRVANEVGADIGERTRRSRAWKVALAGLVVLVAAGAGLFSWRRHARELPALTMVPFTSYPGVELAPTFSPDGNQIAFAWNGAENGDRFDVYVKEIGTETPVRVTHRPVNHMAPAWSPDGRFIAMMRLDTDKGELGVSVMTPAGGNERQLLKLRTTKSMYSLGLSWSADSQWLAFSQGAEQEFHSHLVLVNVNTLETREIPDPSPRCEATGLAAFSPDGKSMAMACLYNFGLSGIFVQPYPSGTARQVQELKGELQGLQWSNDGRGLIYSLDGNLWRTGLRAAKPERLWFGQDALMPAIARQGDRLAFVHAVRNVDIWRIGLGGTSQISERPFPTNLVQQNPQYSPDGKRIAFESTRSGSPEVWVCNTDGTEPLKLSSFGGALTGTPRWSPDGKRIVFDSRASGQPELYMVSSGGGKPQLLPTTASGGSVPYWSHDGQWIYFTTEVHDGDELFKMPAEGGRPVQLTTKGGFVAKESIDGQWLYYINPRDRNAIWRVQTNGQNEQLVKGLPQFGWPAFDVGRHGLYYFDTVRPDNAIFFLDFARGQSRKAVQMPGRPEAFSGQISVAPDEKSVLFAEVSEESSDLMLVEGFR